MDPLQEEDAVDIPEVRVTIYIIYVLHTSSKNLKYEVLCHLSIVVSVEPRRRCFSETARKVRTG